MGNMVVHSWCCRCPNCDGTVNGIRIFSLLLIVLDINSFHEICVAFSSHLKFFNVTGPTLPTLAKNCDVSVSTVSWIFTVRSVAFFIGAATATKIFKVLNPLILMVISCFGLAACLIVIPTVTAFWLLCIMILVPGVCAGFIDAGLQAIILEVWGPEKSRPLIQSFHFMYTIGAFLAPVIMNPFLKLANDGDCSTETACPGQDPIDDNQCDIGEDTNVRFLLISRFISSYRRGDK